MSTKHTAAPWSICNLGKAINCIGVDHSGRDWIAFVRDVSGNVVCRVHGATKQEAEANAARIVACVNACEGYNPWSIFMLTDALRRIVSVGDGEAKCKLDGYALDMLAIATEALAKAAT